MHLQAGALFGDNYEIVKSLGSGGMGTVYLARSARDRSQYFAIKLLTPGVLRPETRERFRNEIIAASRIDSPHIVKAVDYLEVNGHQAFVMEYIDGGDLADLMSKGALGTPTLISVLKQIAMALEAIHGEGIVHRDLKPENILITRKGIVKLTDFGVARLSEASNLTHDGLMVGTPKYLAPEYIETGETDHRGDIYALGVIAYELICGTSPFGDGAGKSLLTQRFQRVTMDHSKMPPDISPILVRFVEKAMSVAVSRRYQSAHEALSDIELAEREVFRTTQKSPPPQVTGESSRPDLLGSLKLSIFGRGKGKR